MTRQEGCSARHIAKTAAWTILSLSICSFAYSRRGVAMAKPLSAFGSAPSTGKAGLLGLQTPYLVYVTPPVPAKGVQDAWFEKIKQCGEAGVPVVQIRDKEMPSEALKSVVVRCREILDIASVPSGSPKTLLFLNGNPELREYSDGIHFPESSLHLVPSMRRDRKRWSGQGPVMGASVHSVEAAVKAASRRVDNLQVGSMFPTGSHPEKLEVEGPALMADVDAALRQACLRERVHLCGIGGITPLNCGNVLRAGADSVAVISGITSIEGSVARTVQAFRDTFARMEEEERRALSNDT